MKREHSPAFQNRGLDQRMTTLVTDDPSAVLPARWPMHIPLVRITTCGRLDIAVLHAITTDATGAPQGVYGPLDGLQRAEKGSATALRLLCLLASQSRDFASRDLISEKLRRFSPDGDGEDDEPDGLKRVDNVVSRLRRLLLPPLFKMLPEAMPVRQRLVTFHRATSESGPGYQLCGLPLIWLDVQVIHDAAKRARRLTQFGQDGTAEWQTVYELASSGPFLKEEMYSDWPVMRRQEVETQWWDAVQVLTRQYTEQGEAGEREAMRILRDYWLQHVTNEDALRPLLEQLAKREGFGQAEAYYSQLCQTLEQEGGQPDRRTRETMEFVRAVNIQRKRDRQSIIEAVDELYEEKYQNMDPLRRTIVAGLVHLLNGTTPPLEWQNRLTSAQLSPLKREEVHYFQQLIENGWELCNAGEWEIAEHVLESFLPDMIRHAPKQQEASLLASQGLVLRSILQSHQLKLHTMIPLCKQAVFYAKKTGDHTTICSSLNGLAVALKYNVRLEESFQTYREALSYCDDQTSSLVRSRIYAGTAAAFAHKGWKQEADRYIHLAYDIFPNHPEDNPHFLSSDHGWYMNAYYHGLMHLALEQPQEALQAFEHYKEMPFSSIPQRNYLEIVNYQGQAAILSHSLDFYGHCLKEGITGALELKSKKRLEELVVVFQEEMPKSWRNNQQIKLLVEQYPFLLEERK